MISHLSPISGVATHGGRYIASAGYDNQVILWDAHQKIALARAWHDHLANQLSFSSDGQHLISASSDHTARLWSVPGMKLICVLSDHGDDVEMAQFHPTEALIATASRDHHVRVFDFQGRLRHCLAGHSADVISIAWSANGQTLLSSSDDGTLKQWSLATGDLLQDIDLGGVETDTIAIANNGTVYAGNDAGMILTIDGSHRQATPAHQAGIKRLVYQDNEQLLVSLSYDRLLRVWKAQSSALTPIAQSSIPAPIWPRSCAFLDKDTLVFATFGSSYALFHIPTGEWNLDKVCATGGINATATLQPPWGVVSIGDAGILKAHGEPIRDLRSLCNFLTPLGGKICTGGQTGALFDAATGETLYQHRSPLNCGAAFMRNGIAHMVIGSYTGEGLVFALAQDGAVHHVATLQLHDNAVKSIAASSHRLFSVCADGSAAWWSIASLHELFSKRDAHSRIANGCAALPNDRFVSVSRDRKLRIWDDFASTDLNTPHQHSIKCVAASPDGQWIATGSYHGCVAIYDHAAGQWQPTMRPTSAGISSLCFDSDKAQFLAGSYDGNIYDIPIVKRH
ncbi:WD40 repeat domain-containing protein [Comamonas sp. MYb396]|uniref:WD40 repeat domain-containing protein n=1 Tax=Comamonas sp. MYb396 TaxID=2745302 RepID=UPI0030956336